jgi:hypothetical protein
MGVENMNLKKRNKSWLLAESLGKLLTRAGSWLNH